MENSGMESPKPKIMKKTIKKILFVFIGLVVLIVGFTIYWQFYFTFSDGYRSGLLQKFSRKGTMFKTYEGEMILSSVASGSNTALASEKFLFSVTDDAVVSKLNSMQGEYVTVSYKEKNSTLWWRGESVYIVDGVEIKKK
jgi:hypothetical protein